MEKRSIVKTRNDDGRHVGIVPLPDQILIRF
jgi:hypothetical protein